eukprot:scaffold290866_cov21-Tisochrysis_lutea.AAC.4
MLSVPSTAKRSPVSSATADTTGPRLQSREAVTHHQLPPQPAATATGFDDNQPLVASSPLGTPHTAPLVTTHHARRCALCSPRRVLPLDVVSACNLLRRVHWKATIWWRGRPRMGVVRRQGSGAQE